MFRRSDGSSVADISTHVPTFLDGAVVEHRVYTASELLGQSSRQRKHDSDVSARTALWTQTNIHGLTITILPDPRRPPRLINKSQIVRSQNHNRN